MPTNTNETPAAASTDELPAVAPVAASPEPKAKRTRKPRAAKPSKPQAPADKATADKLRCTANAAIVQPHYNGPSLATHRSVPPKLAEALARIATPIQRAKSATPRDESAAVLCLKHADASGAFDPVQATSDLGTLSRLASLGYLTVSGNKAKLTKTGLDFARNRSKAKAS